MVLIAGLTSTLCLGDEIVHYRVAKSIFNSGERVAFDPLYDSTSPLGYFCNSGPFWSALLALFWWGIGNVSFPVAQFYHTIYYALLILFTYLLGKELYGQKQGLYAALIVATIPAVAAFSILFYLDIPGTCLSVLCILLLIKRKYFWSGMTLGFTYLAKRNAFFFAPILIFLIFYQAETSIRKKLKNLFLLYTPAFLLVLYDHIWRELNLKPSLMVNKGAEVILPGGDIETIKHRIFNVNWSIKTSEHLNSSFMNPADIIKYFGIVLLIGLAIYLIRKKYKKKDLVLWVPIAFYLICFCIIFHIGSDIRYLLPVIPLLAILASKAMANYLNTKWLTSLFILLCSIQLCSTVLYVRATRQIPEGIQEGFKYLRNETDTDALIIYPEYVILEAANRRFAWAGNLSVVLKNLFWNKDEEKIRNLLKSNDVDYIAIKKSRIYDDSKSRHFGGYPKSFIERLPELCFVKLVFDNNYISIWQVK